MNYCLFYLCSVLALFQIALIYPTTSVFSQSNRKEPNDTLYLPEIKDKSVDSLAWKVSKKLEQVLSEQYFLLPKSQIKTTFQSKVISFTADLAQQRKQFESQIIPLFKQGEESFFKGDSGRAMEAYKKAFQPFLTREILLSQLKDAEDKVFQASLLYIRAFMGTGKSDQANEQMKWTIRTFVAKNISIKDHPPDVVAKYQDMKEQLLAKAGALEVHILPKIYEDKGECLVYLNGANIGYAPINFSTIPLGEYFLQATCGNHRSWVYRITVPEKRVKVLVNVELPETIQVTDEGDILMATLENDAKLLEIGNRMGELLEASQILVSRFLPDKERGVLKIEIYHLNVAQGEIDQKMVIEAKLKNGEVKLRDWKPALVNKENVTIKKEVSSPNKARVWAWVTLGTGLGLIGGAVALNLVANYKTKEENKNGVKPDVSGLQIGSYVMYGLGAAALVTCVVLFFMEGSGENKPNEPSSGKLTLKGGISPLGFFIDMKF